MALAALGVVAAFFLASPLSTAPPTAAPRTSLRAQVATTSACHAATPHAVAACGARDRTRDELLALGLGHRGRLRCAAGGASRARRDRRPVSVACALTRLASAP